MRGTISSRLVGAILLGFAAASPAVAADKVSMRLPWIYNVQAAAYIMAFEKGFYRDAGLEVEIRPGGVQINPNQLVATNQDTFGSNDTPNLIIGRSQGMPLVAVAACWQRHPGGVYALEKSGIREPKDMIGKTLAYDVGGPWTLVQAMLAKTGVPLDKIKLVNASGNEILMNGTVDMRTGFVINGPVAIELAGMKTTSIRTSDYGVPAAAEVVFTTEKVVKEQPDLVRRFVAATIKGYEYAYDKPDETLKTVLAGNPQLKDDQQRQQLARQKELIFTERAAKEGLCSFSGSDIEATYGILKQFGGLTTNVDLARMFTTEFLPRK